MQQTVRVAAAQAESAWLDLAAGADKVISLIGEAAADRGLRGEARSGGAQLIAFGETFIPGYPWWIWLDCPAAGMAFVPQYAANSTTRPGRDL
jgi:nitrilase